MFDELKELMKSDPASLDEINTFKINYKKIVEKNAKGALKRARITAIILASSSVISLVILLFAFTMKEKADELQIQVSSLEVKLDGCKDLQNE